MALVYFIAGKFSLFLSDSHDFISIVLFASEGFALAGVILFGPRLWFGIFIGQLILALSSNVSFISSLSIASINSIEALIGVLLFQRLAISKELSTIKDITKLSFLILLVLQPFSAILNNLVLSYLSYTGIGSLINDVFFWWFGNILGQLLFTPFLLLVYAQRNNIDLLDFMFAILFFGVFSYLLLVVVQIKNLSMFLGLIVLFIIYLFINRKMYYSVGVVITIAYISTYSAYMDVGVYSGDTFQNNIINANFFTFTHAMAVLYIGALFMELEDAKTELKESNDNLAQNVAKKVEIIRNKDKEILIKSRLTQMGEMIENIAHQWRQPLSQVNSSIMKISITLKKNKFENEIVESKLLEIESLTKYMSKTIDDFKDFLHPNKEREFFELHKVVDNSVSIVKGNLTSNSIELENLSAKALKYYGNCSELQQVIVVLLNNATDALVSRKISTPKIYIDIHDYEKEYSISILDNAGGIIKEDMDKIFDPYFTTKHQKQGIGLGLYMSKMIIENGLLGTLSVENTQKGALFKVNLLKNHERG